MGRETRRIVWVFFGLLLAGFLFYALRGVLTPVLLAFLLAYLLDPVADRLEALRVPRGAAVLVLLTGALLVSALVLLLVFPAVVRDLAALAEQVPQALHSVFERVAPWLEARGVAVPATGAEMIAALEAQLRGMSPALLSSAKTLATGVVGSTASVLSSLVAAALFPILTAYLLLDFDRIVASTTELIPPRYREVTRGVMREIDEVLGLFVRGQLLVMAMLGALLAIGYAAVGVPLAVPIGIVGGLLSFIPYVGGAVALGLGVLMSLLHFQGFGQILAVVAVYTAVQMAEGFVITPYIVGDKLGLSALVVLCALLVGGELFGFLGIMLALPVTAVLKVFLGRWLEHYRASALFAGSGQGAAVGGAFEAGRLRLRPVLGRSRALRRVRRRAR